MEPRASNTDIDLANAIVFDAHLIKSFRACEEKYRLFNEEHIIPKEMKAAPSFGIAMHEGVAAYREAKKAKRLFADALEIGQRALLEAYKKYMPPEWQTEIVADERRGPRNALRLLTGYCQHYEPMALQYRQVEIPFAMWIGKVNVPVTVDLQKWEEKDVIYVGIIDAVMEMHSTLYINDLKTTGWSITEKYLEGFKMDQGLIGYVVAAKELLGIDTNYAVVHAMWVQGEAKDPRRAKPLDEYFHTKELYWDQEQINEWHLNVLKTIRRWWMAKLTGEWQMDFGQNCSAWGGCEYRLICSSTPRFRPKIIEVDYTKGVWMPLEDERMVKLEG